MLDREIRRNFASTRRATPPRRTSPMLRRALTGLAPARLALRAASPAARRLCTTGTFSHRAAPSARWLCTTPQLHELLELRADAPDEEVRLAYRAALLAAHPDRTGSRDTTMFLRLRRAYEEYLRRPRRGGGVGFIEFGVGCSFSDDDVERAARAAVMDEASRGVLLRGLLDEAIAAGSGRVPAEPPGAMGLSGAAPPVSMELSSTKKKRRKKMNKHKLRKRRRKNRNKKRPA